ncbi:unnamed protein product [Penicillium bialowiezense]
MRGKGEKSPQGDGQGQPTLIIPPLQDQPELVAQRATVNILNTPWEPSSGEQMSAVNKHFEIPVSLATLEASTHAYPGSHATSQYPRTPGGRSILA